MYDLLIMTRSLVIILVLASPALAGHDSARKFPSPDKTLVVLSISVGKPGLEERESRVEVRTRSGRILAVRDFRSSDGQHGFALRRAEWTSNSRWFIFNVDSSGGHQPWHLPSYAFDRSVKAFYALDDYVGPLTSDFALVGSDSISVHRINVDTGAHEGPVVLHLYRLGKGSTARSSERGRPAKLPRARP